MMFLTMCLLVPLMVLTWQLTVVSPRTFGLCCYNEGDVYELVPLMVLTWQLTVVSPRTFGLCCYNEGDVYDDVSAWTTHGVDQRS